jgi:hypothetical protein
MKFTEILDKDLKWSWNMIPEIPLVDLEKMSDLLMVDLYDLLENTPDVRKKTKKLKSEIKNRKLKEQDLESLAQFYKIIKNYTKMKQFMTD